MSFISNRLQRRKKSQRTAKTDPKKGPVLTGPENSDSKIPLCVFTQRGIFYLPILLSGIPHIRQETAARQIAVPRQIDEPRLVFLIQTVGNCIGRNGQMLLIRESEGFICASPDTMDSRYPGSGGESSQKLHAEGRDRPEALFSGKDRPEPFFPGNMVPVPKSISKESSPPASPAPVYLRYASRTVQMRKKRDSFSAAVLQAERSSLSRGGKKRPSDRAGITGLICWMSRPIFPSAIPTAA